MELLKVNNLTVDFFEKKGLLKTKKTKGIENISLSVKEGEIVALVGTSGSGKTLVAQAILNILPSNSKVGGQITYRGENLFNIGEKVIGKEICLIPQSLDFLDEKNKVGYEILKGSKDEEKKEKLRKIFRDYSLDDKVLNLYPFQLSGGMQRRVLISTALVENPRLVIADEPTTSLDREKALRVMEHFTQLKNKGIGVLLVTHDLELALRCSDRIYAMEEGKILDYIEDKPLEKNLHKGSGFVEELWMSRPKALEKIDFKGREKREIHSLEGKHLSFSYGDKKIIDDFSIKIRSNEIVGLLEPSGRGKTTLCKILGGYIDGYRGEVTFDGKNLASIRGYCPVQLISQRWDSAYNPRRKLKKVGYSLGEEDNFLKIEDGWLDRYGKEVSGGQLQRILISRILNNKTKFIIADEITTMLDLKSQKEIWQGLVEFAKRNNVGILVVSHDQDLLKWLCTRIIRL